MIKPILTYPNSSLRAKCREVVEIDAAAKSAVQDLLDTIAQHPALGLAHPQIGGDLRVFVLDAGSNGLHNYQVFINPAITAKTKLATNLEGCLSFPGKRHRIRRPTELGVTYMTLQGGYVEETLTGYLAIAFQHELDHLNGKLMIDY